MKDVNNYYIICAYSLNISPFHVCPTHIVKADLVKLYFVLSSTILAMTRDQGLYWLV